MGVSGINNNFLDPFLNGVILLCMIGFQTAVNYFNDALDFKNQKDTVARLGPLRMVQAGRISESAMMKAGAGVLAVCFVFGLYLVLKGGIFILALGGLGALTAYFYSAPPLSLADRGFSDLFVFLFFGPLAVLGIVYLNERGAGFAPSLFYFDSYFFKNSTTAVIAGTQAGLLSVALLVVNHLRDREEDFQTGKKTLTVRWGRGFGLFEWALAVFGAFFLGGYWVFQEEHPLAFFMPLTVFPLYGFIFFKIKNEAPGRKYNFYLFLTALGQFLFCIGLSFGLLRF